MGHTYKEDWQEMISAQILAAKSFYDQENSATSPKSYSDPTIIYNLSKIKLGLQLSLEHFNQLSQTSNTSQETGNETVTKNDFSEFPLQE